MTPEALARLTALRRDLHRHPDLSGAEERTAARIAGFLRAMSPDAVLTGLGGHGVVAVLDSAKPGHVSACVASLTRCRLPRPVRTIMSARRRARAISAGMTDIW